MTCFVSKTVYLVYTAYVHGILLYFRCMHMPVSKLVTTELFSLAYDESARTLGVLDSCSLDVDGWKKHSKLQRGTCG